MHAIYIYAQTYITFLCQFCVGHPISTKARENWWYFVAVADVTFRQLTIFTKIDSHEYSRM